MRSEIQVGVLICLASGLLDAQPLPAKALSYSGSWRLNLARSDFGATTITYASSAPGEMKLTAMGQSYAFRMDGKSYPSLFGGTAAWKIVDDTTWETVIKQGEKLISTVTTTVSVDGKTLTTSETGPKQTGGTFHRNTIYSRVSGGPGLVGTWKTKNPPRMPRVVELATPGADELAIRFPDDQESCEAKFDGKDYPLKGPVAQPGMTLALQKTGPRSFHVTGKQYGKAILTVTFEVSEDGASLTQSGSMAGSGERFVAVYDRQ